MSDPLRIVVCVKHVPDAAGERRFLDDGTTDRAGVDGTLSELDEYAVEQALQIVESGVEAEITYLTMGPDAAAEALRKSLSRGGDKAIHVSDEALHGSDYAATALVLAKAIEKAGFDLVVCGMASTDGVGSIVPPMLAEHLGVAQLTYASELAVADGTVRIRRDGDLASVAAEASLPAVVSVTDQTGEARYPSFKGIMAAKKKPVETWSLADLGVDAAEVGLAGSRTRIESITPRPPRQAGTVIKDEGDAAAQLVQFLATHKFV
jgi:electron transfer flavoprotein beta subunit